MPLVASPMALGSGGRILRDENLDLTAEVVVSRRSILCGLGSPSRSGPTHDPEVVGSNPTPATTWNGPRKIIMGPFRPVRDQYGDSVEPRSALLDLVEHLRAASIAQDAARL